MMTPLLQSLRASTHSLHEALHTHPLLTCLQRSDIRLEEYYWCLQAFHAAYYQLATNVHFRFSDSYIPQMLAWLEQDLATQSLIPVSLPIMAYPSIHNYSQWIGMRYVVQGSMLGGRVISKHLRTYLQLEDHVTNHYFAGFGEETSHEWKKLMVLLDDSTMDITQATTQAVTTFKLIQYACDETWLQRQAAESANLMRVHTA